MTAEDVAGHPYRTPVRINSVVRPLRVGDIVALRSGGPEMTVTCEEDEDGDVECCWFSKKQDCCEDYPRTALILVRPIEDGP